LYVSSASVFQPINSYQYYPWSNSPVNGCNLFTAVPLNNGSVLYCGGETNMDGDYVTTNLAQTCDYNGTFVNGLYIYMTSVRAQHTATLLTNGQALITGGVSANFISGAALSSAELYDPVAKAFTATGSMSVARYGHTATLLTGCANAGKVLVAGGNENGSTPELALVSALLELYDPASGQFSKSGSMSTPRSNFTATMLNNGLVLFAGGLGEYNPGLIGGNANVLSSAELYGGLMDGKYVANTYTEYPTVRQPH
jgi:hypothetical protein